ncbi:MAG: hypothetical protein QOH46_3348 [Solirubrobacteraceae bacterium]|nr:hypothetical protein [Solirubrobacteraceae bacterium]
MTAAALLGVLGVLLNQVFIWPQVHRALSTTEGVAALTVLGGLLARTAWTAYGIVLDDLALVCGNVTVATGFLILLILLARSSRPLALAAGAAIVAGALFVALLAGDVVLGWLAVVAAAVVNLPQMLRAMTDRSRLAGVSVPTYLLIATASACWLAYGILVHEPLISAPHLLLLPSALVTAWIAWRNGQSRGAGEPTPA